MTTPEVNPGWRIAWGGLAWLAGVALQMQQAALWPAGHYGGLLGGAVLLVALCWRRRPRWQLLGLSLAIALAGFASTGLRAGVRLAERLDPALEGQDLLLTGVVAAMPQSGASGTRFRFEVESATHTGKTVGVPPLIALGWYRGHGDEVQLDEPRTELRAGQRWRLPVRLKQPHGAMNPQGFDSELWLWEQGLRATGYVRVVQRGPAAERLQDAVAHPVERARQSLRDAITREVSDPRLAGVLAALVVGDQAAIEREDWDLFRNTGIAHLMSISGLHVTMFAWLAGGLVGWAWRRSTRLLLWLPAMQAGRWGGLIVATGYALLAGWGVPAVRTLLMLAVSVLLRSAGLRWPWLLVLLVAGVVVTLQDPWALLQAGFWLSFAAVGLLMMSEPARVRAAGRGWAAVLHGALRSQVVATLGLAPLSLVFFQQLSLVGFVANLLAIPLVTLLITPLAMLGVLAAPLWGLAAVVVKALVAGLAWLASWPGAVWQAPAAPPWAVASGLAAAVVGLLPWPRRVRWLALPLVLPLLLPAVERPAAGQFELLAADVGQGTAVLVRTQSHLLLYDTGPQYSRESDAGQRVLVPLLRARGETRIDRLMLSHRDIDHVGGAASVLAALPAGDVWSSLEPGHALLQGGRPHTRCEDGQSWHWDGVHFQLLHPSAADYPLQRKPNEVSCVLRIVDARGRSALLAGDIEAAQEAALLRRHAAELRSDVLLVPHHGSRTSSTAAWLAAVQPQVAVVQAGYRSRFGHPAPDVMARYAERGILMVRTDQCGAWLWQDGAMTCTRQVRRRYWHWAPPEAGADVANPNAGAGTP
ncbi:DNA internalization-related competence protein ComEC/Rec2 [Aquabacterium sp.]|uniref:DNA internalization-related competence protein ComEC/Rec2 n=1 Tax=Aquabacterium sp. TaxID=1872578 RepID=UPI002CF6D663|nr:DNA internalization-related competence protein ComEC/Rec2 [Aquabacterium sp.]HSW03182.1 DNA internalization-related competence protein ComEC/Rec2 [Aquabacterium sp.]